MPRRITLIANELRGLYPSAGMGTATTFLALALARMGHSVELLIAWQTQRPLDPYWEQLYADAGVRVRRAEASADRIAPAEFEIPWTVEAALRDDSPDVVIASDLSAPAYSALRLRQAGLGFAETLFVIFCHGTRRWVMEMSGRVGVRDIRSVLAVSGLEQAALELADVVVSPSAYLVGWMREQGWALPERTLVIPYFTRSGATGEASTQSGGGREGPVQRLAFFGRLEDKKGIGTFISAVNEVEPRLLGRIELDFVGKPTATWRPEQITATLSERARSALRRVSFATDLDQHEALTRLSRAGTVTVIPSLGDNSPNTVYECLEHGIPFIASAVGGIPELIADEDKQRVLFAPTTEGVRAALERVLSAERVGPPARPTFDAGASARAWASVIETSPPERSGDEQEPPEYVVLLEDDDVPDEQLVSTLARALAATGADAVTCAARIQGKDDRTLHFFSGEPRGLGALSNDYGTVALMRRGGLEGVSLPDTASDRHWPLLAGVAASGARIVSVPLPLVTHSRRPGTVEDSPADALLVLERLEQAAPDHTKHLARLAAGLAGVAASISTQPPPVRARLRRGLARAIRGSRRAYVKA